MNALQIKQSQTQSFKLLKNSLRPYSNTLLDKVHNEILREKNKGNTSIRLNEHDLKALIGTVFSEYSELGDIKIDNDLLIKHLKRDLTKEYYVVTNNKHNDGIHCCWSPNLISVVSKTFMKIVLMVIVAGLLLFGIVKGFTAFTALFNDHPYTTPASVSRSFLKTYNLGDVVDMIGNVDPVYLDKQAEITDLHDQYITAKLIYDIDKNHKAGSEIVITDLDNVKFHKP